MNDEQTTLRPEEAPRPRLFSGDRVLWTIVVVLAVISVLVVYSSTAKMAYAPNSSLSTTHFLRQQIIILIVSFVAMCVVQQINCRIYGRFARGLYLL